MIYAVRFSPPGSNLAGQHFVFVFEGEFPGYDAVRKFMTANEELFDARLTPCLIAKWKSLKTLRQMGGPSAKASVRLYWLGRFTGCKIVE